MKGSKIHLQLPSLKICHFSTKSQKSLVELACGAPLKIKFEALASLIFGFISEMSMWNSQLAINMLLPISKTCLCEKNLTAMTAIKSSTIAYCRQLESGFELLYQRSILEICRPILPIE